MYTLALSADFSARHYLIGGDWGDENRPHAHDYRLEVHLSGPELDRHGYLVDLVDLEARMDGVRRRYGGVLLNDLEAFSGRNPSLERFCRILWEELSAGLESVGIETLTVRLWETEQAWAQWSQRVG